MANADHVKRLIQGKKNWNIWRNENREIQPDLSKAELSEAKLSGVNLSKANLNEANLRYADLSGANLNEADLRYADLTEAILSRLDVKPGPVRPGKYTRHKAHLSGTDLTGASLRWAYLVEVNLSKTILSGADLTGAHLQKTNLGGINLSEANLSEANLSEANLSEANLSEAYLRRANLSRANLSRANLNEAMLYETIIAKTDLRSTKGLGTIEHEGPSHIEIFSTQLPQDGSALHFLRGTGVPEEWIDDYRARMMHPIQYHSCFVSYAHQDEMLAQRLHADLQDQGVRCWFAPEDMKIGDKIRARIDEAIHLQDKLLLLLSRHSLVSTWVEDEVEAAMEKENQQQREMLFPVRLDESVMQTMKPWAAKLRRTRHIGDFTNWTDPQAYQQAFERLLRDLKKPMSHRIRRRSGE